MPRVAERVLKRLRDPKCQMSDIAKELSDDQVTAADVLRIANSVLYRGTQKITTLQGAVTRLGTRVIRTLMLHQSLRSVTFPRKSAADALAKVIWRRSLASGCIMRELASLLKEDGEDAFTVGLLHDIGNVIVLRMANEQEALTKHRFDVDTFEYLCFESHQELGELIAEQWQLPDSIRSLIADHHGAHSVGDPHRRQRSMLMLSDMILQMLDLAPSASYDLLNTPAAKELGLHGRPEVIRMLSELPEKIEEAIAELG